MQVKNLLEEGLTHFHHVRGSGYYSAGGHKGSADRGADVSQATRQKWRWWGYKCDTAAIP